MCDFRESQKEGVNTGIVYTSLSQSAPGMETAIDKMESLCFRFGGRVERKGRVGEEGR